MNSFLKYICLAIICGVSIRANATHNRAGDITYVQIGPLKIRATVTTYTKASSTGADRDSVTVFWGDGQSMTVGRVNGPGNRGEILANDVKRNFYTAEHTYPGNGTYTIQMTDPNRVGNILNLNYPNSVGVPFHLATTFTLLNSTIQGFNNSAVLLQPPIDYGCIGKKYVYNLNAFDPDGDSLSYELGIPLQAADLEVPNYRFPDQILPGPDNKITLDRITGNFEWITPQREGEYNLTFFIHEYRNGVLLNTIIRDMQVTIENCSDDPPVLKLPADLCVIAGTKIQFDVTADDKNPRDKLALSALGGPFNVTVNKAIFNVPKGFQIQPASGTFIWQTSCEHISEIPYNVVFRAVDNVKDSTGLADLKAIRIKVVGPPPKDVQSTNLGTDKIRLTWTYPNSCAVTSNNYFKGFAIWRRINSNQFPIDTCNPNLNGKGYVRITGNVNTKNGDTYFYDDDMLDGGKTYCYRIVAEFAYTSPGGNSFNRVGSIPSDEVCIQLKRDLPFITKASVNNTSTTQGSVTIKWAMPLANDLDTTKHKGPYKLILQRSENKGSTYSTIPGGTFTSNTFANFNDTSFIDNNLNTLNKQYYYQIQFFTDNASNAFGTSTPASTVLLAAKGTDRMVSLTWSVNVPWNNFNFEVYRQSPGNSTFDLIGNSTTLSFIDRNVVNGKLYCYKIQSIGTYGINGLPTPIFNFSEELCSTPIDSSAPCAPVLSINRNCIVKDNKGNVANVLNWTLAATDTCFIDDIQSVNIYFKPSKDFAYQKLVRITDLKILSFTHTPDSGYTGCYYITSLDRQNNESKISGEICPQTCQLEFELPNAFTPNGDGKNDVFKPRTSLGVVKIKFEVYNRWGEVLYRTNDPGINWTGKDKNNKDLADGVYYYTCLVEGFQQNNSQAIEQRKGFIQLIR